ncbi:hypothetical protein GGR36_001682 [Niveibacterium umoris]|uniref:Uncharacterized protein n=1 Tax=Niveibacterium umoris TaxID=1193620 RepID=A0A840BJ48_9RHOO|nr:hypothetical protein [Niveibacterium umoris]
MPLIAALKAELVRYPVPHAAETAEAILKPGAGKTHRACQ